MQTEQKKGFTLIELLIVIAIIAIIAAVTFVALNPLQRFQDSRDASRWQDARAVLDAIIVDQVDNGGQYIGAVTGTTAGLPYMIAGGAAGTAADTCTDAGIVTTTDYVDLSGLVTEGYLASIPVSPNGDGSWDSTDTGYYLIRSANGSITVGACESENTSGISVTR